MASPAYHGEYGVFSHLVLDPLAQMDSERPFAFLAPHSHRKINMVVRMHLVPPAGPRGNVTAWCAPVTAESLSHSLDADGFYLLGARVANMSVAGIPRMSCLYATLTNARGQPFPLQSDIVSAWDTGSASSRGASASIPAHFCLHSSCTHTDVISVPPVMRTPMAVARADAALTGFPAMRTAGVSNAGADGAANLASGDVPVVFHRTPGTYLDTPLLRRLRGGDTLNVPPCQIPGKYRSAFSSPQAQSIPTDWYSYAYTYFGARPPPLSGKQSAPASSSHVVSEALWKRMATDTESALGLESSGSDAVNGGVGSASLIDLRTPHATVMTLAVQADATLGPASMAAGRVPGVVPQLFLQLELFVIAFPRLSTF